MKRPRSLLPRDQASSFRLPVEAGALTTMCNCGDFLEVYTADRTFRIRSPEAVDPSRTNPNAPWVISEPEPVGSASPAVARVLIQSVEVLNAVGFARPVDKKAVARLLHSCKGALVECEKVAARVGSHAERIMAAADRGEIRREVNGRAFAALPQVPNLDAEATAFLIQAKRAIADSCRLPSLFISLPKADTNCKHLARTLAEAAGAEADVTKFVASAEAFTSWLIEMRNYQEHPSSRRTEITNVSVGPDGSIVPPSWRISDWDSTSVIADDMTAAARDLVAFAEVLVLHLVAHTWDTRFPYLIQELDPASIDPAKPIRYRATIDVTKLRPA